MSPTTAEQRGLLDVFNRALRWEVVPLRATPTLLWQQLLQALGRQPTSAAELLSELLANETASRKRAGQVWLEELGSTQDAMPPLWTYSFPPPKVASACAYSAARGAIAVGSGLGDVVLLDAADGHVRWERQGAHEDYVSWCGFDPSGTTLATASHDGTIRIWDIDTAECATLKGHEGPVGQCAFHPTAPLLYSPSSDGRVITWDLSAGSQKYSFQPSNGVPSACDVSPDGRYLCVVGEGHDVLVMDGQTKDSYLAQGHEAPVLSCRFSPTDRLLVTTSLDGSAVLWSYPDFSQAWRFETKALSRDCAFEPSGALVLLPTDEGTIEIHTPDPHPVARLLAHSGYTMCACFTDEPRGFLTCGADGLARLWPLEWLFDPESTIGLFAGESPVDLVSGEAPGVDVVSGCVSMTGDDVLIAGWDGTLQRREIRTRRNKWRTTLTSPWETRRDEPPSPNVPSMQFVEQDRLNSCAVSTDGGSCAAISHSGKLFILDAADGTVRFSVPIHGAPLYACAFAPAGDVVVCGGDGGRIAMVSSASGRVLSIAPLQGSQVRAMAFDPSGEYLATCGAAGSIGVWDAKECDAGCLKGSFLVAEGAPAYHCAFVGSGARLLTAHLDGRMRLWDTGTREVHEILAHRGEIRDVAVNPGGTRAVSVGADGFMRVWECETWTAIAMQPSNDALWSCAVSFDGDTVVCGGHAGTASAYTVRGARSVQRSRPGRREEPHRDTPAGTILSARSPSETPRPREPLPQPVTPTPARSVESALEGPSNLFRAHQYADARAALGKLEAECGNSPLYRAFAGYLAAISSQGGGAKGALNADPPGPFREVDAVYRYLTGDEVAEAKEHLEAGRFGPATLLLVEALGICPRYPYANYLAAVAASQWLAERVESGKPPAIEDSTAVLEAARICADLGSLDEDVADSSSELSRAIGQNLATLSRMPRPAEIAAIEKLNAAYESAMKKAEGGVGSHEQLRRVRTGLNTLKTRVRKTESVVRSEQGKDALETLKAAIAQRERELDAVEHQMPEEIYRTERQSNPYIDEINGLVKRLGEHPPDSPEFANAFMGIMKLRQSMAEKCKARAHDPVYDQLLEACDSVMKQVAQALSGGSTESKPKSKPKKRQWWPW